MGERSLPLLRDPDTHDALELDRGALLNSNRQALPEGSVSAQHCAKSAAISVKSRTIVQAVVFSTE